MSPMMPLLGFTISHEHEQYAVCTRAIRYTVACRHISSINNEQSAPQRQPTSNGLRDEGR